MSISSEIIRLKGLRTRIRTKMKNFGLLNSADNKSDLERCTQTFEDMYGTTKNITVHDTSVDVTNFHYAQIYDPDLIPANVKTGVNIFGVQGIYNTVTPNISYDSNNTFYYGHPGKPETKIPSATYTAFRNINFDVSSNLTLVKENVKQGVRIMGVDGTLNYNTMGGGHFGGSFNSDTNHRAGVFDNGKTLILPVLTLQGNNYISPTAAVTSDIQVGWLTNTTAGEHLEGWMPPDHSYFYVIYMEIGRNRYESGMPMYLFLDVMHWRTIGADRIYHLIANDSEYSLVNYDNCMYIKIRLGNSFNYAGVHPVQQSYCSFEKGGEDVVFMGNNSSYFPNYHIDLRW